jgi:hypothetical protein
MRSALVLTLGLLAACAERPRALGEAPEAGAVAVVARTPYLSAWPCAQGCHARRAPDPTPRALREFHVGRVLQHGPTLRWCGACHPSEDLDHLRLVTGEAVSFDEAFRLCGQCHAEKHRDWERGIHGAQSGSWAGVRRRRSCVLCHDPHAPQRPAFDPLPSAPHDRALDPGAHP